MRGMEGGKSFRKGYGGAGGEGWMGDTQEEKVKINDKIKLK